MEIVGSANHQMFPNHTAQGLIDFQVKKQASSLLMGFIAVDWLDVLGPLWEASNGHPLMAL